MKQRSRPNNAGLGVGMVSILIVFVILCLTTFATLSLVSARADLRLTNRAADSLREYYAADSAAQEQLAQLDALLEQSGADWQQLVEDSGVLCELSDTAATLRYQVAVNERKQLLVALTLPLSDNGLPDGPLAICEWRVEPVSSEALLEEPMPDLAGESMFGKE